MRNVADHETHVRWIYLTTVLCMGECQKYARNYCIIVCLTHMLRDKINGNVVFRAFFHLSLTYIVLMQFTTDDVQTSLHVKIVFLESLRTRIVLNVVSSDGF